MFTAVYWLSQLEYLARLVVACLCGACIGYERSNRLKEAGIRTHLIVSLAAALMMIISKYGFSDVLGESVKLDPSRVAAGIVSGIGFLGAGMIFVRKQAVSGLTTAAGVWATMGVGMAVGSGMYILGVVSTLLIILAQVILHRNLHWLSNPVTEQITVQLDDCTDSIAYLQSQLALHRIQVLSMKAEKIGNGLMEINLNAKMPQNMDSMTLANLFKDSPYIKSLEN